jgi:hypothetical protein
MIVDRIREHPHEWTVLAEQQARKTGLVQNSPSSFANLPGSFELPGR